MGAGTDGECSDGDYSDDGDSQRPLPRGQAKGPEAPERWHISTTDAPCGSFLCSLAKDWPLAAGPRRALSVFLGAYKRPREGTFELELEAERVFCVFSWTRFPFRRPLTSIP